jgi:hypothetical protein
MEIASITMMFIRFWIVLVGCHLFCRPLSLQHVELLHLAAWLLLNSLAHTQRKPIGPRQADSAHLHAHNKIQYCLIWIPSVVVKYQRRPAIFIHAMIFFVFCEADFFGSLSWCTWAYGQMIYLFGEMWINDTARHVSSWNNNTAGLLILLF